MKKMLQITVIVLGFLSLVCLQPVLAQPGDGSAGMGMKEKKRERKEHFQKMAEELNLTQEQQDKIEANKKKFKQVIQQNQADIRQKKEELRAELDKPQLDMTEINQLQSEIKALLGQREDSRLEAVLDMRTILTPEQFVQFRQKMEETRSKFQQGRKKGWKMRDEENPEPSVE